MLDTSGLVYLALAVACSLGIGVIFKLAAGRAVDRLGMLTVNYAAACALGVVLGGSGLGADLGAASGGALGLGALTGALFIAGFFLYASATATAGLSVAVGVMRLSVAVPFLASWGIWGEVPTLGQGAGLLLAGGAFVLMARRGEPGEESVPGTEPDVSRALVLMALFVVGGFVDVLLKVFSEAFGAEMSEAAFLSLVFGTAAGIGAALVLARRARGVALPGAAAWAYGMVLGAVNYGSAAFLIAAIQRLPGPFVFPANSIAVVLGGALLGVAVWGERLGRSAQVGLGVAALALLLLSLG